MKRTELPAATDTRRVKRLSTLAVSAVGSKVLGPCCPQLRSHPAGQERWLGTKAVMSCSRQHKRTGGLVPCVLRVH